MSDVDYVKYAVEALTKPSDFGWWGPDEMFDTWGFSSIAMNRDSDIAQISNYHAAIKDLKHKFGNDYDENFYEVGLKHWAVGHVDELCCRILNKSMPHDQITSDDITPYFKECIDITLYLRQEYPILDEDDYSERQWKSGSEWLVQLFTGYKSWFELGGHVILSDETGDEVQYWLCQNDRDMCEYMDDGTPIYNDDDIIEAVYDLGYDKREDSDDNEFWSEWELNNPSLVVRRYNRRNEEAGQLKLSI